MSFYAKFQVSIMAFDKLQFFSFSLHLLGHLIKFSTYQSTPPEGENRKTIISRIFVVERIPDQTIVLESFNFSADS